MVLRVAAAKSSARARARLEDRYVGHQQALDLHASRAFGGERRVHVYVVAVMNQADHSVRGVHGDGYRPLTGSQFGCQAATGREACSRELLAGVNVGGGNLAVQLGCVGNRSGAHLLGRDRRGLELLPGCDRVA